MLCEASDFATQEECFGCAASAFQVPLAGDVTNAAVLFEPFLCPSYAMITSPCLEDATQDKV